MSPMFRPCIVELEDLAKDIGRGMWAVHGKLQGMIRGEAFADRVVPVLRFFLAKPVRSTSVPSKLTRHPHNTVLDSNLVGGNRPKAAKLMSFLLKDCDLLSMVEIVLSLAVRTKWLSECSLSGAQTVFLTSAQEHLSQAPRYYNGRSKSSPSLPANSRSLSVVTSCISWTTCVPLRLVLTISRRLW